MDEPKWILVLAFMFLSASLARAQNTLELTPTDTVKVANHKTSGILAPVKCDALSNIYARPFSGAGQPWDAPIVKISADGKTTDFPMPRREGKALEIMGFAPGVHEGVVMLTMDHGSPYRYYVETYNDQGEFDSRVTLPAEFHPLQIAAATDGRFLISGFYSDPHAQGVTPGRPGKPFAGIFGPDGRLERDVLLAEDGQATEGKESANASAAKQVHKRSPLVVTASSVDSSPDENFILSRTTDGGPIYVISAAGFVLESFDPPSIPGARLDSVNAVEGYLAAVYMRKKAGTTQNEVSDLFISLLNPQTGEEQLRYHGSPSQLGLSAACYDKGVFSFLTIGDDGALQIVKAK